MMLANFLVAWKDSSSDLAPVQTNLPDANISAVVLGSLILMITAANRFGLYSVFLQEFAIFFKSKVHFKSMVETTFYIYG